MTSTQAPLRYDPYDYAIDANPHPVWRRLRDEAPLYRNDELDFYALSRYDDVLAASLDVATFSSAHATVLPYMTAEPGVLPGSILFMDPPVHDVLRRLISRGFTPRRVGQLQETIRAFAVELLEEVRDLESFDYVDLFAAKLPPMVIGAYLGLPVEDAEYRRRMTDAGLHIEEGEDPSLLALKQLGIATEYYREQVRDRKAHPRDDMITDLCQARAEIDGTSRELTEQELVDFISLMSSAGNETVARALGWGAVLLARNPDQRELLLANPELCKGAFEELLRYEAPSPVQGRWVEQDVELHGETVKAGSRVLLLTGSATRDERQFPDPDRFDVRRRVEGQLSFGFGIHYCLGAALAREEGRIALQATLSVMPTWDVGEIEMVHTASVRGPAKVKVHRT